jgi:hypothetical protein
LRLQERKKERSADLTEHKGGGGNESQIAQYPQDCKKYPLDNLNEQQILGKLKSHAKAAQDHGLYGGGNIMNPQYDAVVPESLGRVLYSGYCIARQTSSRRAGMRGKQDSLASNIAGNHLEHAKPAGREDNNHKSCAPIIYSMYQCCYGFQAGTVGSRHSSWSQNAGIASVLVRTLSLLILLGGSTSLNNTVVLGVSQDTNSTVSSVAVFNVEAYAQR